MVRRALKDFQILFPRVSLFLVSRLPRKVFLRLFEHVIKGYRWIPQKDRRDSRKGSRCPKEGSFRPQSQLSAVDFFLPQNQQQKTSEESKDGIEDPGNPRGSKNPRVRLIKRCRLRATKRHCVDGISSRIHSPVEYKNHSSVQINALPVKGSNYIGVLPRIYDFWLTYCIRKT